MCLYPRLIRNKRYMPTRKNGGNVPPLFDERMRWIPAACGKCYECRKAKRREWQVRLTEESKGKQAYFVTLTISPDTIDKYLAEGVVPKIEGYENTIAKVVMRRLLERCRKQTGKSVKHWFVTELGETNDRIHLHGLVFSKDDLQTLVGNYHDISFVGSFVNLKTINYITKYMLKTDDKHKWFTQKVFCSAGLGKDYIKSVNAKGNVYRGEETNETYRLPSGQKMSLPIYYRNLIYTDEEREMLWYYKIEKNVRWVDGQKYVATDLKSVGKAVEDAQYFYRNTFRENVKDWDIARWKRAKEKLERKQGFRLSLAQKKDLKRKYIDNGYRHWIFDYNASLALNGRSAEQD